MGTSTFAGTLFSVTPGGVEKVIHAFGVGKDGVTPTISFEASGRLYGTTVTGGKNNYGTIFSITTDGAETILYNFSGAPDGAYPYGGLVRVNRTFYGSTSVGGASSTGSGNGTVYSVTSGGIEKVVHSFTNSDGPLGSLGLLRINGLLYGATNFALFSMTTSGDIETVHDFKSSQGQGPAAVIELNGKLYGTGTAKSTGSSGCLHGVRSRVRIDAVMVELTA